MLGAIERGYFRRKIADSAVKQNIALESGESVVVGVNEFVEEDYEKLPILKIGQEIEDMQVARLKRLRKDRDPTRCGAALDRLRDRYPERSSENLVVEMQDHIVSPN